MLQARRQVVLLIEPVWNRNLVLSASVSVLVNVLLIEPVWNRNREAMKMSKDRRTPFNRTSMESKHTPMAAYVSFQGLLIEPVWNRNIKNLAMATLAHLLLIEPVWNRNRVRLTGSAATQTLLIEPVWNRNPVETEPHILQLEPFNRTSMESKRIYRTCDSCDALLTFNRTSMESKHLLPQRLSPVGFRLLIEPVWNRNMKATPNL